MTSDTDTHPTKGQQKGQQKDALRRRDRIRLMVFMAVSAVATVAVSLTAARLVEEPESIARAVLNVSAVWAYAAGASVLCFWLHFRACRITFRHFLARDVDGHPDRVLWAMLCMGVAHLGEMTLWGVVMWCAAELMGVGSLSGDATGIFVDYLHFAFAAYTSLGLGDVMPENYLKLITGACTLTGLLCIGWTASLFVGEMGALVKDERD